jgi:hypothetical protein
MTVRSRTALAVILLVFGSLVAGGATGAKTQPKPKTFRGLVVIGCRKYSALQSLCYAARRGHPEARSFYVDRNRTPRPGRVADVRGRLEGQLIDAVTQVSGQTTWTIIRGNASETTVVGTVRSIAGRKTRTISFFVSIWTRCKSKPSYCMAEGAFKARVPSRLNRKAENARTASRRGVNAVFLLSLRFKKGKVSLTAIDSVPASKRRP